MGLRLEVIFVERGTCGSREQCTGPTKEMQINVNALLSKPTLKENCKVEDLAFLFGYKNGSY